MIPQKIKTLIDRYCMGVVPSDEQMDEIMNLVMILNADAPEVSAYMKEKIAGPTKEEFEAAAKAKAEANAEKKEKNKAAADARAEARAKKAQEAKLKNEKEAERISIAIKAYNDCEEALRHSNFLTKGRLKRDLEKAQSDLHGLLKWTQLPGDSDSKNYKGGIFYAIFRDTLFLEGETYMPDKKGGQVNLWSWPSEGETGKTLRKNITKVIFFGGVKSVNFYGVRGLNEIMLPDTVEGIERDSFRSSSIKRVDSSKPLEYIEEDAFWGCKNLEIINVSSKTRIANYAFYDCNSLPYNVKKQILEINPKAFDQSCWHQ